MYTTVFEVLRGLDNHFLVNQLPYCIVGRTETVGSNIEGDIDIIIRHCDVGGIHSKIFEFCKRNGLLLIQCVQHEHNAFCFVIVWLANGNPEFLKLDICSDYHKRGRLFLRAEELLAGRIKTTVDGNKELKLFVASPLTGFLYYLVKKIDRGMIDDDQGFYLHNQWKKDPAGCRRNVSRFWDEDEGSLIARACETNNWTPVRDAISRLRGSLHRTVRVSWRRAWGELFLGARRALRPAGLVVAFPGREGLVKSSVVQMVESRIAPAFSRCVRCNLRPGFLSFHAHDEEKRGVGAPHNSGPHGPILSVLKLIRCWLYYTSKYLVVVRWKKAYSTLVVLDQCYVDILASEECFRSVPLSIASLIGKCIPKPDVVITITSSTGIDQRYEGKWQYQNDIHQSDTDTVLSKDISTVCYIYAEKSIDEIAQNAGDAILEYLNRRTIKNIISK